MEGENDALEKAKKGMKEWQAKYTRHISELMEQIRSAKNIDEFMRAKKALLLHLIDHLPLNHEQCPFCLAHVTEESLGPDCNLCEYARKHGCCHDANSTYGKIHSAKLGLISRIRNYW